MYAEIAANKRKSFVLVTLFLVLIFALAAVLSELAGMGRPIA